MKKLDSPEVSRRQIRESTARLHSKYIDSHNADHLSRLKLGKTFFNAQLHHINQKDDPYCEICKANNAEYIPEDYKHALYACPNSQSIINNIINTFFPTNLETNHFTIADILLTNKNYYHKTFKEQGGKETINLIWDIYQVQVTINHTAGTQPRSTKIIKAIITTLKDILKIQSNSLFAKFVKNTPYLQRLTLTR